MARASMPLLVCSVILLFLAAWEFVRLSVEKVEFAIETITFPHAEGMFRLPVR